MKTKKRRYTSKQLYDLWIQWVDECNINAQEFYRKYNLEGSFINWLEKRELKRQAYHVPARVIPAT
jgi:hypothetical protein